MLELSSAIFRRSLPGIGSSRPRPEGLRGFIQSGSFYIDPSSSADNVVLKNLSASDLIPYAAFDFQRFALASWESFLVCRDEFDKAGLLAWPLIKLYYAAFFAAHASMRVVGQAVLRIEAPQARVLSELVTLYSSTHTQVSTGTFRFRLENNTDGTMDGSLERLPNSNGAHEGFWRAFLTYLEDTVADLSARSDPSATAVAATVVELTSLLKSLGATSGTWLSVFRNQINYQHSLGVWFPVKGSNPAIEEIKNLRARAADTVRLDINASKYPISAFVAASHMLTCLSYEFSDQIASQSGGQVNFSANWKRLKSLGLPPPRGK